MQLPLFPLHTVLFPHLPLPLHIFEERYRAMAADLLAERLPVRRPVRREHDHRWHRGRRRRLDP